MTWLKQIIAASRVAVLGVPSRIGMSLSAILSVAMVVIVLLGFLSMASGFRSTMESSGSDGSAVILAEGASSEMNSAIDPRQLAGLERAPEIARASGVPLLSYEAHAVVSAVQDDGIESNVTLRGMGEQGLAVRPQARLTHGRMFVPGTNELVVGQAIAGKYRDLKPGRSIRLAGISWNVVGLFASGGAVMESEVWADRKLVTQLFEGGSAVQSVRLRLTSPASLAAIERRVSADPTLKLNIRSEKEYLASQARGTSSLILYVGWPLGVAMAVGALAGALNTMFTSVSTRTQEIGTLRTLGFPRFALFFSTMAEAMVLVLIGGVIGILFVRLFLEGLGASTMGANMTQVMFRLHLTATSVVQAFLLVVVVGLTGGIPPSWRAARRSILRPEE